MITFEELTTLVGCVYILALGALAFCLYLFSRLESMRERERRQKFKNEVVDEVCSYFEQTRGDNK